MSRNRGYPLGRARIDPRHVGDHPDCAATSQTCNMTAWTQPPNTSVRTVGRAGGSRDRAPRSSSPRTQHDRSDACRSGRRNSGVLRDRYDHRANRICDPQLVRWRRPGALRSRLVAHARKRTIRRHRRNSSAGSRTKQDRRPSRCRRRWNRHREPVVEWPVVGIWRLARRPKSRVGWWAGVLGVLSSPTVSTTSRASSYLASP